MFGFLCNSNRELPLDVRTKIHNCKVELCIQKQISQQLIKNQEVLERRIMNLEKKIILNKIE
jgi:hypothetical protein